MKEVKQEPSITSNNNAPIKPLIAKKKVPKLEAELKRPITPLVKRDPDLTTPSSPRIVVNPQKQERITSTQVKRSSSIKKVDKEDRDKKDKYKAKIAWNAQSPSGGVHINSFKEAIPKLASSPTKANNMLKKELLEKAKQALSENVKVNVGLDIKKLQETLNKVIINKSYSKSQVQGTNSTDQSQTLG